LRNQDVIRRNLPPAILSVAVLTTSASGAEADFPRPFDVGVHYIRDLHVDSSARPGGDGSREAPLQSVAEALRDARPGTRVRIAPGTYGPTGTVRNLQGTVRAPIAIVGEGEVVFTSNVRSAAMHLVDARHVVIQGITIRDTWPHGLNIDDGGTYASPSSHVVLRDVLVSRIGNGGNNDCVKMSGVDYFYVENSYFSGCNMGEAIDMVGCHHGVIARNVFANIPGNAVQTKGGSSDILIHGNRFRAIGQRAVNAGGATGEAYFRPTGAAHEAERIRIIANIIENTGGTPITFAGCQNCVFANNTIVAPGDRVARIVEENTARAPGSYGYFVNNVIIFETTGRDDLVDVGSGTLPETYTFGWNLWSAVDAPEFPGPRYRGGLPPERNAILAPDPGFGADWRPLPGSPAIGAGREVPGGLPGDFDRTRYETPPTVGAIADPGL